MLDRKYSRSGGCKSKPQKRGVMWTKSNFRSLFIVTLNFFNLSLLVQPSHQHRRYIHLQDEVTWSEAQTYCRKHHTDLATFKNKDELDSVQNMCLTPIKCWIGLTRDKNDPDVWQWSDGEAVSFTKWEHSEPNNINEIENCVLLTSKMWYDAPCWLQFRFLCYEDLVLVKQNKTWEEAVKHCRTLERSSSSTSTHFTNLYDLPNMLFEDDESFAKMMMNDAQTDKVWIGLRFLAGQWMWLDGSPLWKQLPACPAPGMNCGTMSKTEALFQNSNCLEKNNFFCVARNASTLSSEPAYA